MIFPVLAAQLYTTVVEKVLVSVTTFTGTLIVCSQLSEGCVTKMLSIATSLPIALLGPKVMLNIRITNTNSVLVPVCPETSNVYQSSFLVALGTFNEYDS